MAHNLNKVNGKVAFAQVVNSVQPIAWHGLGQHVSEAMTAEQAIELGGLDYQVLKTPAAARIHNNIVYSDNMFATYRSDTGEILGFVGKRYEIVQNKDAFKFFDAIVGSGQAVFDTVGALGKGERIFISAKLPSYIKVKGDAIEKYLLLTMAHDGTASIQAAFTPIRVVCNNTLNAALRRGNHSNMVRIRHTSSAIYHLKEASKLMNIVNTNSMEIEKEFNLLANCYIDEETSKMLLESFFKKEKNEELSARASNMINEILEYTYSDMTQMTEACKGTLFGLFNGISGYYQNRKEYTDGETKFKNLLLEGTDFQFQSRAYDALLQIAESACYS